MTLPAAIEAAARRIAPHARRTPLLHSLGLSRITGADVYLKLESLQYTGSFKARGALNKVLGLTEADRCRPIVTASTGNHGAAVAYALSRVGLRGTVWVPETCDPAKVSRIEALGGTVRYHGTDSAESEAEARRAAAADGGVYISPYNDLDVVAGQGTVGLEITARLPGADAVYVAVGGGGLISGIAGWLRSRSPDTAIVGVSPRNSCVMVESVRRGEIVTLPSRPTLSDGTAGGVEPGAITFPWCRDLVSDYDLVDEPAIADAMRLMAEEEHLVVEGAAGVAVASMLAQAERWRGRRVVVVICGGNVGSERLGRILSREESAG